MNIKKLLFLICALFAFAVYAAEPVKISMVVGTTKSVTVPFAIESYRVIPKSDKVRIETTDSQLRIMADAVGDLSVLVEGDGLKKEYVVSVKSNLTKTLKKLRTDLDALTELDISINEDEIVIRGVVTNPEHWNYLDTVLAGYSGKVVSYAVFRPSAQTLQNLRTMLEKAGFRFADDGASPKTGELSMTISPDAVTLTGELYSAAEIGKIRQILATQTWLSTDGSGDAAKGLVRGIVNLSVIETIMQVDVVYVGISDSDMDRLGTPSVPKLSMGLDYLYKMLTDHGTQTKTATFGGNMDATVSFLARNGISRSYNAGHVSFSNNDPEGGRLHTGGTIYAKVNGIENGSLQNIEYGLMMTVKGGLVSPTTARLTLDLENSSLIGAGDDSYNVSKDSTKQTILCDINKTIAVAGSRKIAQETQRSGLPIIRNTPVLKWFVSEDADQHTASRLLILVCPRIQTSATSPQIEIPLENETGKTFSDAQKDSKEELDSRGSTGNWFLDWFRW